MKSVIYLVMLSICSTYADVMNCDLSSFYLELGCTPMPTEESGCPVAFNCPDLHPDPNLCYYRGLPYPDRSTIPQSLIKNPCSQACSCNVDGSPRFECAAVDCVETFDSDAEKECISTYELDSCCSTGTVCGKDAIASLKTCEVDGVMYKEGQTFEPANTRKTCVCTAQFAGKYDDPSICTDINCGIEIHYQEKIFDKCAPVFVSNFKSCPISFECPTNNTKVIRSLNRRDVNAQCTFGNMTLNPDDRVLVEDSCTECSCDVPPFLSCMKKISCDD